MIEEITTSEIEEPMATVAGSHNHSAGQVDYHWA